MTSKAYHRALTIAHLKERLLKVLAVIFAFWLWYYVQNSKKEEFLKDFQVQYKFADGKTFANEIPSQVRVKLFGPKAFVRTIQSKKFAPIIIDITQAPIGISQIELTPEDVPVPVGVKAIEILPKLIPLQLEKENEKELGVQLELSGAPPEGYLLESLTIEGDPQKKIKVKGPESLLSRLNELHSKPIVLSQLKGKGTLPLEIETKNLSGLKILEKEKTLHYELSPIEGNFKLRSIPIEVETDYRVALQIPEVTLIVKTTTERMSELRNAGQKSGIKAMVHLSKKSKGKYLEKIDVSTPDGVTLVRVIPTHVSLLLY